MEASSLRRRAPVAIAAGVSGGSAAERVERMAMENAVVVFSMTSCCMCHVVKQLFSSMGVSPLIVEIDRDPDGPDMEKILLKKTGQRPILPAVFIGGKLIGGLERVMAAQISGNLNAQLIQAGAIWL